MHIDVVIPSLRPSAVGLAVRSLSLNTRRPDLITIVSNEISEMDCHGLNVSIVRFSSGRYPVGRYDVVLRRNIGIWISPCTHVITFDDDQVAPADLVASSATVLERSPYFWGHHRYIRFAGYTLEDLVKERPDAGQTREHPANAWHSWLSAYAGLAGARRELLLEVGGYDMAFCGRHAGEDQNLGRRLARHVHGIEQIYVHEPPFAWHPEERLPWAEPRYSNLCSGAHELVTVECDGRVIQRCGRCPYFSFDGIIGDPDKVLMPFELDSVNLLIEELS